MCSSLSQIVLKQGRGDPDAFLDARIIFQEEHRSLDLRKLPELALPKKGRYGLIDYEKAFCADPRQDIFVERKISRDGAIVLVRPDQYVAHVLALNQFDQVKAFFAGFLSKELT